MADAIQSASCSARMRHNVRRMLSVGILQGSLQPEHEHEGSATPGLVQWNDRRPCVEFVHDHGMISKRTSVCNKKVRNSRRSTACHTNEHGSSVVCPEYHVKLELLRKLGSFHKRNSSYFCSLHFSQFQQESAVLYLLHGYRTNNRREAFGKRTHARTHHS